MNTQDAHHVVPNLNGGWDTKRTNAKRASRHCDTKKEAIEAAKAICENEGTELIIHDKEPIVEKNKTVEARPKTVHRENTVHTTAFSPMNLVLMVAIAFGIAFFAYLGALGLFSGGG